MGRVHIRWGASICPSILCLSDILSMPTFVPEITLGSWSDLGAFRTLQNSAWKRTCLELPGQWLSGAWVFWQESMVERLRNFVYSWICFGNRNKPTAMGHILFSLVTFYWVGTSHKEQSHKAILCHLCTRHILLFTCTVGKAVAVKPGFLVVWDGVGLLVWLVSWFLAFFSYFWLRIFIIFFLIPLPSYSSNFVFFLFLRNPSWKKNKQKLAKQTKHAHKYGVYFVLLNCF